MVDGKLQSKPFQLFTRVRRFPFRICSFSHLGMEKEVVINTPGINDYSQAVEMMYDITSANVDVRVVMGSTRAKSPSADLARDIGLMNAGIYDKTQVIMNMQADVDKAGLIQRMGETSQLMAENQQLKQQLPQA